MSLLQLWVSGLHWLLPFPSGGARVNRLLSSRAGGGRRNHLVFTRGAGLTWAPSSPSWSLRVAFALLSLRVDRDYPGYSRFCPTCKGAEPRSPPFLGCAGMDSFSVCALACVPACVCSCVSVRVCVHVCMCVWWAGQPVLFFSSRFMPVSLLSMPRRSVTPCWKAMRSYSEGDACRRISHTSSSAGASSFESLCPQPTHGGLRDYPVARPGLQPASPGQGLLGPGPRSHGCPQPSAPLALAGQLEPTWACSQFQGA